MARRKYRQAGLGGGALLVQASPLVSGTAPRAQVQPFKPQAQAQPRLDWGEELPPVVIPKPPARLGKAAPEAQLNMFHDWEIEAGWDQNGNCLSCGEAGRCRCYHPHK